MRRRPGSVSKLGAAVVVSLLAAGGCATNPVTGKSQFTLMGEQQEVQLGTEMDGEVRREMGLYDDPELQRYVEDVGRRLAAVSHRPELPWHFAVVDQPAVNAFALPGGYIYLTRGILPFLDTEAEMAGVLGHEIGHVTARHAAAQYTKATSAGAGLAVLSILVPEARPYQGLAETAFGVLFLKYGRDDELQADRLGAEYSGRAGWDPRGVAGMLATLSRLDEASSSARGVPGWLSTHPDPGDRARQVQPAVAQAAAAHQGGALVEDHDGFLRRIDGLVYGDDPEDGVVRGGEFLHGGLRFRLAFPERWTVTNTPSQVTAEQPGAGAALVLQLVTGASGSLDSVAATSMANAGFRLVQGGLTEVGGQRAFLGTYRRPAESGSDTLAEAAHVSYGGRVYLIAGLAAERGFADARPAFLRTIRSFRSMTAEEAARLRPDRIDLYVVRQGDTWDAIAARAGDGVVSASTLAIMNHHPVDQQPRPGERIKIVVGSR